MIKCPDILPSEGYNFKDVQDAALFCLSSSEDDYVLLPSPTPQTDLLDTADKLMAQMSALVQIFTAQASQQGNHQYSQPRQQNSSRQTSSAPAPGGASQNSAQWGQSAPADRGCHFCGEKGHYVKECPIAAGYLQEGRIVRGTDGHLLLADRQLPHRGIPGITLKERFDNYARRDLGENPKENTASMNFLQLSEEYLVEVDVSPAPTSSSTAVEELELAERIEVMQAQLATIQAHNTEKKAGKQKFDGVEVPPRTIQPKRDQPEKKYTILPQPKDTTPQPNEPSSSSHWGQGGSYLAGTCQGVLLP